MHPVGPPEQTITEPNVILPTGPCMGHEPVPGLGCLAPEVHWKLSEARHPGKVMMVGSASSAEAQRGPPEALSDWKYKRYAYEDSDCENCAGPTARRMAQFDGAHAASAAPGLPAEAVPAQLRRGGAKRAPAVLTARPTRRRQPSSDPGHRHGLRVWGRRRASRLARCNGLAHRDLRLVLRGGPARPPPERLARDHRGASVRQTLRRGDGAPRRPDETHGKAG